MIILKISHRYERDKTENISTIKNIQQTKADINDNYQT